METSKIEYLGGLRTRATHIKSGQHFITDAPVDNKGKGEAFSPTDLLATSLGACMVTIIGIAAAEHGFNIDGTEVKVTKIMESNPRRVGEVVVQFIFPKNNYTDKQKRMIENAAYTCPVAKSLHPDLKQTISFEF